METFWQALSAIGTILAVIVALFITKWQDRINNRKDIQIRWSHAKREPRTNIERIWDGSDKSNDGKHFDYIFIKLINTGNRVIFVTSVLIKLSNNHTLLLLADLFTDKTYEDIDTKFPCRLEKEEVAILHIPICWFYDMVSSFDKKYCISNEKIVVIVKDTADKEYIRQTGKCFNYYIQYYDKIKSMNDTNCKNV